MVLNLSGLLLPKAVQKSEEIKDRDLLMFKSLQDSRVEFYEN